VERAQYDLSALKQRYVDQYDAMLSGLSVLATFDWRSRLTQSMRKTLQRSRLKTLSALTTLNGAF